VSDLVKSAVKSVDSLLPTVPSAEILKAVLPDDIAVAARGIKLRAIYPEAARANAAVMHHLLSVGGSATEVRTSSATPSRIVIVDKRIVFIRLEGTGVSQSASITSDPGIVTSISGLFDALWTHSRRIVQQDKNGLSRRQIAILRSITKKATDDSIARDLKISTRTERQIIYN
jgi:hypothetical protein